MNANGESLDSEKADSPEHVPVLLEKAIELLNIRPGLTYVDATAGGGGHLSAIDAVLKGQGRLIANDRDAISLGNLKNRFADRPIDFVHADYKDLSSELGKFGITTVSGGILADLGVSSMQIDDPARGFSFSKNGPLDMRMDDSQSLSAYELVNELAENELADIIFKYGEERHSRGIARNIVRHRPLQSTAQLADVVASAVRRFSGKSRHQRRSDGSVALHPATRTFQALRIAVNSELDSLNTLLSESTQLLAPGARLVVITFHSLEDRLVKDFFRLQASDCICPPRQPVCTCDKKQQFLIINRKPFVPDEKEVLANIRSRSAKLRAGEKLP